MSEQKKYHAFISYRHADNKEQGRQWATWLHQAIETYEIPADLVGKKNGLGEPIPSRIYPIFRDEEELPADTDLGKAIANALDETKLLIVLCSPRAVASTYVAEEIDYFKKSGHSDKIIAAIIDGEPNASWDKGKLKAGFKAEDECFPIPLQFEYDKQGNKTTKHAEPIAADFRINNNGMPEQGWTSIEAYSQYLRTTTQLDNKQIQNKLDTYQKQQNLMLLKIIAGILGVPLSELTQRDKAYQLELANNRAKKLRRWLIGVFLLAVIAIGAGVIAYFKQQEAIHQKQIADKMLDVVRKNVNFMNFNLRVILEKYVPIKERTTVINKLDELVDLLENNALTVFDKHAIAVTYFNKVNFLLSNKEIDSTKALKLANKAHEMFLQLQLDYPDNLVFKDLLSTSYSKLGDVQLKLGMIKEATFNYESSLNVSKQLIESSPNNSKYNQSFSLGLIKIADMQFGIGKIDEAFKNYQSTLERYKLSIEKEPENIKLIRDLSILYLKIAEIYDIKKDNENAYLSQLSSLKILKKLVNEHPNNNLFKIDLTASLNRVAYTQIQLNFKEKAIANYQESLNIDNYLAENDKENIMYQKNLIASNYSLAKLFSKYNQYDKALEYINIALIIIYKDRAKLDASNNEKYIRAMSSDAALYSMKKRKYKDASKYLMNYFKFENIYANYSNLSSLQVNLLRNRMAEYLTWSWYMLFTNQVKNTIPVLKNVIGYLKQGDERIIFLKGNLAHAYILSDDYESAKAIYTKFKGQKFSHGSTWQEGNIQDFKDLKNEGIEHPDFTRIAKEVFGVDGF